MYVLSVQYSCAVVSVFLFGGKANLVLLTLFYSTLLALSGKPLQTDGRTEEQIHLLCVGWRNLPTLRVSWRNLFSSCAVVSVFGSGGKQALVVHTTMYLEYHTVVVLGQFFWFWREIVFGVTSYLVYNTVVRLCHFFCCGGKVTQCTMYSCAVVSVFWLQREIVCISST